MRLTRGLWLTLIDEAEEALPVACEVAGRGEGEWLLEATVPPQVYPVTFVAAELRLDGHFLGRLRLEQPVTTVTHEPLDLRLRFPVPAERLATVRGS